MTTQSQIDAEINAFPGVASNIKAAMVVFARQWAAEDFPMTLSQGTDGGLAMSVVGPLRTVDVDISPTTSIPAGATESIAKLGHEIFDSGADFFDQRGALRILHDEWPFPDLLTDNLPATESAVGRSQTVQVYGPQLTCDFSVNPTSTA
jgi:hypothetical protein